MGPAAFVCDETAAWVVAEAETEEDDVPEGEIVIAEVLVTVTTGAEDWPVDDAWLGNPFEGVVVGDGDEGVVDVITRGDVAVADVPEEAPFMIVN